jgi:hypothetical protein
MAGAMARRGGGRRREGGDPVQVPFVSLSLSALLLIDRRKQRLIGLSPYACRAGYDTAARFLLIRAQYSALEKILKYTKYGRRRRVYFYLFKNYTQF